MLKVLLLFLQMYFDWLCITIFSQCTMFFFYLFIHFLLFVCDAKNCLKMNKKLKNIYSDLTEQKKGLICFCK